MLESSFYGIAVLMTHPPEQCDRWVESLLKDFQEEQVVCPHLIFNRNSFSTQIIRVEAGRTIAAMIVLYEVFPYEYGHEDRADTLKTDFPVFWLKHTLKLYDYTDL